MSHASPRQFHPVPKLVTIGFSLLAAVAWGEGLSPSQSRYQPCIDYFTVGESACRPQASTPVPVSANAAPAKRPQLMPPKAETNPVDEFLANYGKPPREYVEFYLNPTMDNAVKWAAAYQQQIQRGEQIAQAWSQAEKLYQPSQLASVPTTMNQLPPVPDLSPSSPAAVLSRPKQPSVLQAQEKIKQNIPTVTRLGAFTTAPSPAWNQQLGGIQTTVSVDYFFSATCPYCARLNSELIALSNTLKDKLVLTCVDVTPIGASTKPQPSNVSGKIPCNWRLPNQNEVENRGVRQTPTLFVKRGNDTPVRLSGYMTQTQLLPYLLGR